MKGRADTPLRIPDHLRNDVEEIFGFTDVFCAAHLDAEYGELVRKLVAKLARKRPSPLARGDLRVWAGTAIYVIGSVNFLFDRTQRPHLTGDQLSQLVGVPKSTLANKAKVIRDLLRLGQLDPEFSRQALLESHGLGGTMSIDDVLAMSHRPARPPRPSTAGERKLSEIIKEMACHVLRRPDDLPSFAGAETAVIVAAAAWNAALGDSSLRERHEELVRQLGWAGNPWGELSSTDTDRLVASLIEYKPAHYADDRRRIMACGANPEFNVRVEWMYEDDWIRLVPGASALVRTGSGGPAVGATSAAAVEKNRSTGGAGEGEPGDG
ncbi:MAG: DUF6398 domain-containing protein [Myxococcota bacterium]|nr:DUF6398 domain-containing protein [Myxococcota bacterium]